MVKIYVLRLGHRPKRDKRVTTHVGLVARTFGADRFVLVGSDSKVISGLNSVSNRWGDGKFEAESIKDGKKYVNEWKKSGGFVVHLTMYGLNISNFDMEKIKNKDLLVVVGAEKVEPWYYENADYNIAVANQPHSEVSALAIFLDRYYQGKELDKEYISKLSIKPMKKGKYVTVIPDELECIDLLKNEKADDKLLQHSEAVYKLAIEIGRKANANLKLITAGALLHDIGKTKVKGLDHGYVGAEILRRKRINEEIAKIAERHIGAGLTKEEIIKNRLNIPKKDYIPRTLEEKIVAEADNLINGSKKVNIEKTIESYKKEGLNNSAERILKLHEELSKKCKIDLNKIDSNNFK